MATNSISSVMQFSTPDAVGRIATALEFDHNKAQFAASVAVSAQWTASNEAIAQNTAKTARQHVASGDASNWRISLAVSVSE